MTPSALSVLNKSGVEWMLEAGAGTRASFPDAEYAEKGVRIASRAEVLEKAAVVLQVRGPGANPEGGAADLEQMHRGQVVIGFGEPLTSLDAARALAAHGVDFLAMELMPRITRAQSMDALSSMATVAGYKAVLLAADSLPRMFPMLMTAAGTVAPAPITSTRHRAALGRGGERIRHSRGGEGTDRKPGRALCGARGRSRRCGR